MIKNLKLNAVAFSIAACITSQAGAAVCCPTTCCTTLNALSTPCCMPFFAEIGSGVSFTRQADVSASPINWDPSPDGYNSDLGNSVFYMAGLGYTVNPLLNIDINITHRGDYEYQKFQRSNSTAAANPLGDKTRNFDVSSTAYMFNATVDGQGISNNLVFRTGCRGFIQPFVGAGAGVSYNKMSDFHTVLASNGEIGNTLPDHTTAAFAYQFNGGLEWQYQRLSLDVGYRYFDGGNIRSANYYASQSNAAGVALAPTKVAPWKANLSANELFATAKVAF